MTSPESIVVHHVAGGNRAARGPAFPRLRCVGTATLALACVLTVGACIEEPNATVSTTGTDAGNRVLRLDTIVVIQDPRIWLVRELRLVSDGVVALVGGSSEVIHFDLDGRVVRSFGGKGEGPGEFSYARDLVAVGDSVYVLDSMLRRISLFVRGEFGDGWSLRDISGDAQRLYVVDDALVIAAERGIVHRVWDPPGPHFFRRPVSVLRMRVGAEGVWTRIFSFEGPESQVTLISAGTHHSLPAFGARTSYDFTESGIVTADHRSGRVALRAWDGRESVLLEPAPPTFVDSELEQWEEAVEERLKRLASNGFDPAIERPVMRAGIERWNGRIPRPVFEDAVASDDIIALERYQFGDDAPREGVALDREGRALGSWTVGADVRIRAIQDRTIAAVSRDSLDVESILVMRIMEN